MSEETTNSRSYYLVIALSVAIILMAAALYSGSQGTSQQTNEHTIHINGYAEQKVVSDTASLSIGVVIQAPTAKEASDENAVIMNAVMDELKALGIEDKDIRTFYVSVNPVYNYEGERTITGYSASNNVQVTTMMLENLSAIIDRSTAAGANRIGSISFSVSDEMQKDLREELIDAAIADASSKAEILADNLNVGIIGVQSSSVSDSSGNRVYYEMPAEAAAEEEAATPVKPGESTVSISVQVTYLIE